jgi:hypothetical protein
MAVSLPHTYCLALKISGWQVSLSSPEPELMQRQMALWVGETTAPQAKTMQTSNHNEMPSSEQLAPKPPPSLGLFDEPVFSGPLLEAVEPFPETAFVEEEATALSSTEVKADTPAKELAEATSQQEELPEEAVKEEPPAEAPEPATLSSVELPPPFQPLPPEAEELENELDWPEDESTEAIEASLLQAKTVAEEDSVNSLDAVLESIFEDLEADDNEEGEAAASSVAQLLPQPFMANLTPQNPAQQQEQAAEALPETPDVAYVPSFVTKEEEALIADVYSHIEHILPLEAMLELADLKSMDEMLALTAYFLSTRQNEPHFSLKRLNDTITELGYASFTHGDMELAVNQNWLAVRPDANSFTEATLYELTEQGRYFSEQQLG